MIDYYGKQFKTLNEWLAITGATIPAEVDTLITSFTLSDLLTEVFGARYVSMPYTTDADVTAFNRRFAAVVKRLGYHYKPLFAGLSKMIADLIEDGETETIESKRAHNGSIDFETAFSDGGTVRNAHGSGSGNTERLRYVQQDLENEIDRFMHDLEVMFIPVRGLGVC